jgi:hypothetical protein
MGNIYEIIVEKSSSDFMKEPLARQKFRWTDHLNSESQEKLLAETSKMVVLIMFFAMIVITFDLHHLLMNDNCCIMNK